MKENRMETIDNYAFHFLDEFEYPAVQLMSVGKETRCLETYYWDNQNRPEGYLFQYTVSGSGVLQTNGQEHLLTPGQAFFLHMPGTEKYYYKDLDGKPWTFYYILFRGSAVRPYFDYIQSHAGILHSFTEYHPAVQLLTRLHKDAVCGKLSDSFTAGSRVFEFLCCLCSSGTSASKYSALVARAKALLERDFSSPEGIGALADRLGVSPSHLSREFSRELGLSPVDYLQKLRLEKALELLGSTNLSISEIATACGFSCGNYFDKVFKRYMKISPRKFREYMRREGYRNVKI